MAADKGLVAVFLRLTQGGFRLEEGALTMERDADPDGFGFAANGLTMNAPDDAQWEEHDGNLLSMDDWLYYSIRTGNLQRKLTALFIYCMKTAKLDLWYTLLNRMRIKVRTDLSEVEICCQNAGGNVAAEGY